MNWRRRRVLAYAVGSGTTAVSGCLGFRGDEDWSFAEPPTGTWQQSAHDARNTSASDVTVPDRGTRVWNAGDAETVPPLVAGETVYSVGDGLTALDARTGEQQWQTARDSELPRTLVTQPAVTEEHVLLGTEGRLVSFDPRDGSEQWQRSTDGVPIGPITVAPDRRLGVVLFERPEQGEPVLELVAFAVSSGKTEWTAPIRASGRTMPPAVCDGRIYASGYARDETPILRCFEAETGALVWERELDDPATPPIATADRLFVGDGGDVIAYDPSGGERLTTVDVTDREISAIAVADGSVFVLAHDGLSAVSVPGGTERWSVDGHPEANGLAVGRNTVVAPIVSDVFDLDTSWPCIGAFDRADGELRWYHAIDDTFDPAIGAPPVIADGAVFVLTNTRSGVTALGIDR